MSRCRKPNFPAILSLLNPIDFPGVKAPVIRVLNRHTAVGGIEGQYKMMPML
jgi:hypothetical protein